jgi:hypothetical protein
MAKIVLVISTPESIDQSNAQIAVGNDPRIEANKLCDLIMGIASGAKPGPNSIQVTVRDTDPSVATSGSGSTQVSYVFS